MKDRDSCIIRHFNHYLALSESDKALLEQLERSPVEVRAGDLLWAEQEEATEFCTLRSGWAFSFRHMEDGSRQVLDVFLPGDIVGLREFAFSQRLAGVQMIEDGVICRFPHAALLRLFRRSTTLTSVMFAISSRQQALLTERLVNLARRSAKQKLAHFILEMYQRLRQTEPDGGCQMRLPMSQELLADLLGLSPVHVSRTFTALDEARLLHRNRQRLMIPDLRALARQGEFDDRYLIDNSRSLLGGDG